MNEPCSSYWRVIEWENPFFNFQNMGKKRKFWERKKRKLIEQINSIWTYVAVQVLLLTTH
jgi:hypothetical protein